jgi:excisionase family DNA binding protein
MSRHATVRQLVEQHALSRSTWYRLLAEGEITAKKVRGRRLFDLDSVERYLQRQPEHDGRAGGTTRRRDVVR